MLLTSYSMSGIIVPIKLQSRRKTDSMRPLQKTKSIIKIFIQHFCSKQTIVTGFLAVLTGLLPILYQNYKTIESRLLFICMYGVLFLLLFILGIMWIYRAAYPQEEIKRPKLTKREMLNTILNVFISWIGIGLIEWLIQSLYQKVLIMVH